MQNRNIMQMNSFRKLGLCNETNIQSNNLRQGRKRVIWFTFGPTSYKCPYLISIK